MNVLRRNFAGSLLIAALLLGCAADKLHRDGLAEVERGNYEAGVSKLADAVAHAERLEARRIIPRRVPRDARFVPLPLAVKQEAVSETLTSQASIPSRRLQNYCFQGE